MDPRVTNIKQSFSYTASKQNLMLLALGALCLVLGAFLAHVRTFRGSDFVMLVLTFVVGGSLTLYALFRTRFPGKPAVVMSPEGLRLHIPWLKDVLIPWRDVKGVDSVDITGRIRGHDVTFRGVTVVLVSRRFYDRHIHVSSWIMRGPGWDTQFIPQGSLVQVALHHEALSGTADELRTAAETRWRTFGKTTDAASAA